MLSLDHWNKLPSVINVARLASLGFLLVGTNACISSISATPTHATPEDAPPCEGTGTRGDANALEGPSPAAPIPVPSGIELSSRERSRPCRAPRNDIAAKATGY